MYTLLAILIYVGIVFLARWLNYKAIISEKRYGPIMFIAWIVPILNIIICIVFILVIISNLELKSDKFDWFTGKHWKTK